MSLSNRLAARSEKGLLTPDNCVVAFIDHEPQMLFATANFDRQSIINSTVALAKATRIFDESHSRHTGNSLASTSTLTVPTLGA